MAKKNESGYLSAKESRRISRENRKITDQFEKLHKRKNVPEEEFLTQMHDQNNSLEIENLHTYFFSDVGTVRAVDGVSFDVPIGKTVGVVGESGCGKSVTSLSIMQLLQRPQGQVVEGEIRLNLGNGKAYDITKTPIEQMQKLRGNYMSMIFQEPMTSLNRCSASAPSWTRSLPCTTVRARPPRTSRPAPSICWRWPASPTARAFTRCSRTSSPAVCASAS